MITPEPSNRRPSTPKDLRARGRLRQHGRALHDGQLMTFIFTALLLIGGEAQLLHAATHEIVNPALAVVYDDDTQSFSVTDRATGLTYLSDGKLEGKATVRGRRLVVEQGDGSTTLELRGAEPFLFITRKLVNDAQTAKEVKQVVVTSFRLNLPQPASALRTLGTGGLKAPDENPGSYLFLTCADPATRRGVVTGFITEDRGSGVLFSQVDQDRVTLKARLDYGHLRIPPEKSVRLETLVVGFFEDARLGEEQYAELIRQHYHIRLPAPPAVYCSWYAAKHGGAGDEKSTLELARFVAKELKPFGLKVIQIDDGWQGGGEFNGPRRGFERARADGPYPHGIAPVAKAAEKEGLTFGLWWLPFARNYQDPEYRERQNWFVKDQQGKPYDTRWGGTCLDLTEPEVKAQLAELARAFRSWGVRYFKMDGLYTGAACKQNYINDGYKEDDFGENRPFHDPFITNIEAYRNGLKLLRKSAGNGVFFSGCCVAQNMRELCALGLVDSMRIGPDYNADGLGARTGPLRGSRLYFLNGRVWWNDPDPAVVQTSVKTPTTLAEARRAASWVALSGQFFLSSDWLPELPADRLEVLKRTLSHHTATARPVDCFDRDLPTTWLVTATNDTVLRNVIGVFNWDNTELKAEYSPAKLGLPPARDYFAFDFWADEPIPSFSRRLACTVPAEACRVIAVRPDEGHPVLVSTSRHVTQGILEVRGEKWSGDELSAISQVVGGDPYELRIAGVEGWKLLSATVSAADRAAGVTARTRFSEPGWLRVTFQSKSSRAVKWRLRFASPQT